MLNVTLEVQPDRSIPAVVFVADHFIQLLLNLLGNAVDACRDRKGDALILIQTRVEHGRVMMEVRDNGCGMSPETLTRACEPFFTTKPAGEGMGLGLALCHTLVEEGQGNLRIKSAIGEGTSAFVSFTPSGDNL
jgi:C4-dicarboxylate-specific signal transduction histidine kinase